MEETDVGEENHICPGAALEEESFLNRRSPCGVGNEICRSGCALQRLFSYAPIRCVGGCGRTQDSGLVAEGLGVLLDWMKIDCSGV